MALILDLFGVFPGDVSYFGQVIHVAFANGLAGANGFIENRLRERRLVSFIVSVASIAIHIDDHILFVLCAIIHCQANNLGDGLGVLSVHMEDGALKHAGDIGGVDA